MKPSRPQLPEPADLVLSLSGKLPLAKGTRRTPKASRAELADLEIRLAGTRVNGGLVADINESHGAQKYWCDVCHQIFPTKIEAANCHNAGASKISICRKCNQRLSDCACPSRFS